jgi:hypothetical protein
MYSQSKDTMDNQPRTRQESKKSAKEKKHGHNTLGSGKGTRQKEALAAKGFARNNEPKK